MRALTVLALVGLMVAPAWGLNYDVVMTSFNASGSIAGGGNYTLTQTAAGSSGSIPVVGGQVTGGQVSSTLRFNGTSGLMTGVVVDVPRAWALVKDGHPFQSPLFDSSKNYHLYDPAQFPVSINPGDPVPSAAFMLGKDGANSGTNGITINLMLWDLQSVVSRTPLPGGGESILYNVAGNLNLYAPGYGIFNTGYSGTMTLQSVPEPSVALLLLAGLPLIRRRR